MPALLQQILRRGAIVAAILAVCGFGIAYLAQSALAGQHTEPHAENVPVRAALVFATIGFALLVVLELLAAGYRAVAGKKPPEPPIT